MPGAPHESGVSETPVIDCVTGVAPLPLAGGEWYATRLSTLVLVRTSGEALFIERTAYAPDPADAQATPRIAEDVPDRVFRFTMA